MPQNRIHSLKNVMPIWSTLLLKSIVQEKVTQLVGGSSSNHQQQRDRKICFKRLTTIFPYVLYGQLACRLLLYAYVRVDHQAPEFLLRYDLFIGSTHRADIKLDRTFLLSLIGIPILASVVHYILERRIGETGSRLAAHLFDVINRNAAQVEEAIGRSQSSAYLTFTYRQVVLSPLPTAVRLLRTLAQLYTGSAPLRRPLQSLHLHPQLPLRARQRTLYYALLAEIIIRAVYLTLSGKLSVHQYRYIINVFIFLIIF